MIDRFFILSKAHKYFLNIIFFALTFTQFTLAESANPIQSQLETKTAFIENNGQWHQNVSYLNRAYNQDAWILKNGCLLLNFYKITQKSQKKTQTLVSSIEEVDSIKGHRVLLNWISTNEKLIFHKSKKQQTYYNYFIGNNPKNYATKVALYEELIGENLYPGIDVRYYFSSSNIRYDLIVHPHQNANQIKIKLDGISTSIDNDGNVMMHSSLGDIKMQDLYVYEKETKKQITCKWVLGRDSTLSFALGPYNKSNTLIIDPLIYSTYLGGTNNETSDDIVVNNLGEAYITGSSQSPDFDTTVGAYQSVFNGGWDCYVSKFNSSGTALLYSTFFGGSSIDKGKSIVLDSFGNSYITGSTMSTDYCVTSGVYQNSHTIINDYDAFVTKLNSNGTGLIYSTYLGGSAGTYQNARFLD